METTGGWIEQTHGKMHRTRKWLSMVGLVFVQRVVGIRMATRQVIHPILRRRRGRMDSTAQVFVSVAAIG